MNVKFYNVIELSLRLESALGPLERVFRSMCSIIVRQSCHVCLSGDFRREDLARAWLDCIVQDVVRVVFLACSVHGLKRVFFAGGPVEDPVVRHAVTREMSARNMIQQAMSGKVRGGRMSWTTYLIDLCDYLWPSRHIAQCWCKFRNRQC